ncbi:class I SAM-dependent RNA methyltransferase [Desulfovibrio legallii]|uniref:23S rRNA (Uracil1939-C5)-methyltransferase n=1 Tax=Desulfovibrio legallii TaxID=571438 RepID=A0A1G7IU86_9BACT|nr:TRAM domain-containing protein [Desulfovibrio legallii]SDF16302.1 23S rRNA (uracil1939-C5)-methyltransferase [Desulfovibrio legallii]
MSDDLTLDIHGLSHDGRGVARLEGSAVVFVAGGLPGQRVRARVLRRRPRFWEAACTAVLREAPDAAPPLCPHREICGGCPLQAMPMERQLTWKRTLALDALTRVGGLDRAALEALLGPVAPSPALTRFRNKMEFAFGPDAAGLPLLGLRERGGRRVTPVPGCALLPPEALRMADLTQALVREQARANGLKAWIAPEQRGGQGMARTADARPAGRKGRPRRAEASGEGFWRFLTLRRGLAADLRTPRWWALCLTSPGDARARAAVRALGRELLAAFPQLAAFVHEERASADAFAAGERRVEVLDAAGRSRPEAARLHLPLLGRFFALDAASFFQVNTGAAQLLARTAQEMLPNGGEELLDLYCGVGAPGLLLAPAFSRLYGLELDPRAVALARENAARLGAAHCRYAAGDAARLTQALDIAPDAVLADPPRAGLAPAALTTLLRLRPRRILYISCNAATLARDAAALQPHYRLARLAAVDLFPHTPHVECLALWQRP